jgi:hypothetical protein
MISCWEKFLTNASSLEQCHHPGPDSGLPRSPATAGHLSVMEREEGLEELTCMFSCRCMRDTCRSAILVVCFSSDAERSHSFVRWLRDTICLVGRKRNFHTGCRTQQSSSQAIKHKLVFAVQISHISGANPPSGYCLRERTRWPSSAQGHAAANQDKICFVAWKQAASWRKDFKIPPGRRQSRGFWAPHQSIVLESYDPRGAGCGQALHSWAVTYIIDRTETETRRIPNGT